MPEILFLLANVTNENTVNGIFKDDWKNVLILAKFTMAYKKSKPHELFMSSSIS